MTERMEGFLDGVVVLDLTEALSGPYCGAILSDFGAEVIKVERPEGDVMRRRGSGGAVDGIPFQMIHRNKKSLAVDIRDERGADVIRRLARSADALVENFRPGVLTKRGLGYEELSAASLPLVYCSISGFGQTGPLREVGAVDLVAQGHSGLMSVTGTESGELVKAGFPVSDLSAGMWAAMSVIAALRRAERTGQGAHLDIALVDSVVAWAMWELADYQISEQIPGPIGTAHRLVAPYQAFACQDGRWITLAAVDRKWPEFCELIDAPFLPDDERFETEYGRFEHRQELAEVIGQRLATAPADEWITRLRANAIPCGIVNDISELLTDPQLTERTVITKLEHDGKAMHLLQTPVISDGVPGITHRGPRLGEHTLELCNQAGLTQKEIESLVQDGIITTTGN